MVSPDGAMVMAGLSAKRAAQSWINTPSVVLRAWSAHSSPKSRTGLVPCGPTRPAFDGLVGARGFEPPTPCSRSRCATRLRYAPHHRAFIGACATLRNPIQTYRHTLFMAQPACRISRGSGRSAFETLPQCGQRLPRRSSDAMASPRRFPTGDASDSTTPPDWRVLRCFCAPLMVNPSL